MESRPRRDPGKQPAHAGPQLPLIQPPDSGSAMPLSGKNEPIPTQYRFRWDKLPIILAHRPSELDDNLTLGAIDCSTPHTYIGARESIRLNLDKLPSISLGKVQTVKGPVECDDLVVRADISSRTLRIHRGRRHKISPHVVPDDDEPVSLTIGRKDFLRLLRKERGFLDFCYKNLEGFETMVSEARLAPSDSQQYWFGSSIPPPPNPHVHTRIAAVQRYANHHQLNTLNGPSESSAETGTYRGPRSQLQWENPFTLHEQHQMVASAGFAPEPLGAPDNTYLRSIDFSGTPFGGASQNFIDSSFGSTSLVAPGDLPETASWDVPGRIAPGNDFTHPYDVHSRPDPGPSGSASNNPVQVGVHNQGSQSRVRHRPYTGGSSSQVSRDSIEQQPSIEWPKSRDNQFK